MSEATNEPANPQDPETGEYDHKRVYGILRAGGHVHLAPSGLSSNEWGRYVAMPTFEASRKGLKELDKAGGVLRPRDAHHEALREGAA